MSFLHNFYDPFISIRFAAFMNNILQKIFRYPRNKKQAFAPPLLREGLLIHIIHKGLDLIPYPENPSYLYIYTDIDI